MIGPNVMNRFAMTAAATIVTLGAIASISIAAIALKDGDNVNGFIRNNSPSFTFRNQARTGAPSQTARGEDYTFTAQRGDYIEIAVDVDEGSNLQPVMVLLSPAGRQVAFDSTMNLLKYRVPATGTYRLLVLGLNNTRGRYTLAIDGLSGGSQTVSQADQVMRDLGLRSVGCGIPNVSRVKIGTDERCTLDLQPPAQYVYDATSRRISVVDTRRDLLAQRLQLNILDRCPSPATSVAQITMTDPQDGRDYTYCATPTRFVRAGVYRYNVTTDDLQLASNVPNPQPTTNPLPAPQNDARRQLLQNEYGLTVLDSCPAARSSLVVVSFPESDQTYVYCARPNRLLTAGEYTYNVKTNDIERAAQPAPACTVSIGGICLVK